MRSFALDIQTPLELVALLTDDPNIAEFAPDMPEDHMSPAVPALDKSPKDEPPTETEDEESTLFEGVLPLVGVDAC